MAYRDVLAVQRLAVLAVVDVGIVEVDEVLVVVGDQHPVRGLGAGQAVAADQHQRLAAPGQLARDVSPGANRWGATFVYNYTQGIGRDWVLEANLEAQFYAKNDDYFGSDLEQKPLYRLQAFASYDFSQSTYGALKLVHADGGELKLQGHTLDDTHQRYTQLGFELGHWLDRRNSLMFGLSRNVATDNAFHGSQALLRLVHVF